MNIFKCKADECPFAPCYIQCDNAKSRGSIYDGDCGIEPCRCPHDYGDDYACSWVLLETPRLNTAFAEELFEWLSGEGWDSTPEEFRDMCFGCGIEPRVISAERAADALRLIREYDNDHINMCGVDLEDWQKRLDKVRKIDLLNGIFPEAFRAGMIYGEMLKQKQEKTK